MENNNIDETEKEASSYSLETSDSESLAGAINEVNHLFMQQGVMITEYLKAEESIQKQIDSSVEAHNMLVRMARQKVNAPENYVLNLDTMEFIPRQKIDK